MSRARGRKPSGWSARGERARVSMTSCVQAIITWATPTRLEAHAARPRPARLHAPRLAPIRACSPNAPNEPSEPNEPNEPKSALASHTAQVARGLLADELRILDEEARSAREDAQDKARRSSAPSRPYNPW